MAGSKLAWAGLLDAGAKIGNEYLARERALEEKRLETARELRKEQAKMARDMALKKYEYDLQEPERKEKSKREDEKSKREARKDELDEKKFGLEEKKFKSEDEYRNFSRNKPSDLKEKIGMIQNQPGLSPEEKKKAILSAYGVSNSRTGEMSEYQRSQILNKLMAAEEGGVDDTNLPTINTLRDQLGMKRLMKVESKPGKKGLFKDTPAEYNYVEETDGSNTVNAQPSGVDNVQGGGGGGGIERWKSMLKASGSPDGTIEMTDKKRGGLLSMEENTPTETTVFTGGGKSSTTASNPQDVQTGVQQILGKDGMAQLQKMNPQQLQAVKQGLMDSKEADLNSPEMQEIMSIIDRLIMQKRSLVQ